MSLGCKFPGVCAIMVVVVVLELKVELRAPVLNDCSKSAGKSISA